MKPSSTILIFIDEETTPICEVEAPFNFELNTEKLIDGMHQLKIVSRDLTGKEGIKKIPFEVRNGPAIIVEGISNDEIVDGILPITINAYSKGNQQKFVIHGSESPLGIPSWVFVIIIAFISWALYYLVMFSSYN
ncbi:MAG: cytochrome C [Chitinophagaceae bacterium]|nr:MAG: cytochrome C [Chitinophagaceae bacterium]